MEEEEEMDSLFEGMVLFDPTSNSSSDSHHPSPPPPQQNQDNAQDPKLEIEAPPSSSSSEPLDENLFSDLTVQFQTPPPPLDQDREDPIKTTSRQNSSSRKKKRAAGLRIGYARDANAHSHDRSLSFDADDVIIADGIDSLPEPSPSSHSTVSLSVPVQSQPEPEVENEPEVEPEAEPKAKAEPQSDEAEATPELRSDQSKALIVEKKLSSARQLAASVSSARKDAIARRRTAADNLNLASGDYADWTQSIAEGIPKLSSSIFGPSSASSAGWWRA